MAGKATINPCYVHPDRIAVITITHRKNGNVVHHWACQECYNQSLSQQ